MLRLPLDDIKDFIKHIHQELISNDIEFIHRTDCAISYQECPIKTSLYSLITFNNSKDCLKIYILDVSTFTLITYIKCSDVSSENEFHKGFQFFKYCNNVILTDCFKELALTFFNHIPKHGSFLVGRVYITDKHQQEQLSIYLK